MSVVTPHLSESPTASGAHLHLASLNWAGGVQARRGLWQGETRGESIKEALWGTGEGRGGSEENQDRGVRVFRESENEMIVFRPRVD